MKTYKVIEHFTEISRSSLELMGMKKDIKSFEIESFCDFGEMMINENFVSTISSFLMNQESSFARVLTSSLVLSTRIITSNYKY